MSCAGYFSSWRYGKLYAIMIGLYFFAQLNTPLSSNLIQKISFIICAILVIQSSKEDGKKCINDLKFLFD
ncbi:hypothetical protein F2A31_12920 [Acinetobacter suaedae]|uniref:Uncharacterized protein n=1 Tax=Acinetobacter suaedae TaxID=2609668 RepID=A0A5P1UWL9_9GAMM|nr:hypothetical protein F2A31_12920 [Acinetobacter sp. C16S1]